DSQRPINVELQINKCRTENMGAEAYAFDASDQKDLTTFVKHQSLGTPVSIDLSAGEMQSWWDKGKDLYYTRTGQLNFSCSSCHQASLRQYIRADHLSPEQVNVSPHYRFTTGGIVSVHYRFGGCIRDTRGDAPGALSDGRRAREPQLTWRGTGPV